jgi:hypothetical protein
VAIRNATPWQFRPRGVSDTADEGLAFPGAMSALTDVVPAPDTNDAWVPRPASVQLTSLPGLTPDFITGYLVVGDLLYGLVAPLNGNGHDTPFVYNLATGTFLTVDGILLANQPLSPPKTGAWTPPILCVVGTRIMVTHPGFDGVTYKIGWFDISSFTDAGFTVNATAGSATLTTATSVLLRGWQIGQFMNGTGIAGNSVIIDISADGKTIVLNTPALGTGATSVTITGGTPTRPLWGAGDTIINRLPSTPTSVAQMNGRAWYACGVYLVFSDSLAPTQITNASQALAFGNGIPITALGELPLKAPLQGGVVQSIIAFQSNSTIQQVTGDQATNNLAKNAIKAGTGTLAPLSVISTLQGLAFISPEGLRIIDAQANVSDPIGRQGQGVCAPFANAVEPSRICGAGNALNMRFSVQNALVAGQPYEDYWYDLPRGTWSGPHSLPAALVQPWRSTFVMVPVAARGALFRSDTVPTVTSSYNENGTPLTWRMRTAMLADNGLNQMNAFEEMQLACGLPAGSQLSIVAADDTNSPIDQIYAPSAAAQAVWGAFNWGAAPWSRGLSTFMQRLLPWTTPIVFKQGYFQVSGASQRGVKVGPYYGKRQVLGSTIF